MLKQNAENMRQQLVARSLKAGKSLLQLRDLLSEEGAELSPARRWVERAKANTELLMDLLSVNEQRRMDINSCYYEIEDLTSRITAMNDAQNSLNGSLDDG